MKVFVVLSVVAACAFAKPTTTVWSGVPITPLAYTAPVVQTVVSQPVVSPVVSSQYHAQDELGQYTYGYSSGLASKVETKTFDGITKGGYSYLDAEGKLQNVQYTADPVHGFRVAATNLPVGPEAAKIEAPKPVVDTPEVTAAKIQHMAAVEEAKTRKVASEFEVVAPVVAPIAPVVSHIPAATHIAAPVTAVKYAAPGGFSYGYTATAPYATYASNFVHPIAYSAPVAYPHGYAYTAPSFYNFVPKFEDIKVKEIKA